MSNLTSSNVRVFPSTRRASYQKSARELSESAIVGLINKLVDMDGFVITNEFNQSSKFEFNIYGYYFTIYPDGLSELLTEHSSDSSIYANIKLERVAINENDPLEDNYVELVGQDDSDTYYGLEFSTSPITDNTKEVHYLLILEKNNGSWRIPTSSKLKFDEESGGSAGNVIDGGEI